MLEISKKEKNYLVSKGLIWGKDLHRTIHNRSYYLTETYKNMRILNSYRRKNIRLVGEN